MMDDSEHNADVAQLADEFADRCARGERPSVAEYQARHPHVADQLRAVLPLILQMHQCGAADAECEEPPMRELGDYRLLREIGRGGMGVVYEAHQTSLGRRVALKVLPASVPLAGRHHLRFELESRAAARLHHSNIVPVYGVGEQDGVRYYVMQLIDGCGLDEIVREIRRRQTQPAALPEDPGDHPASPRSKLVAAVATFLWSGSHSRSATHPLSTSSDVVGRSVSGAAADSATSGAARLSMAWFRSIARLGANIADALHYAHSQGVLHRDVKPSNVMLDASGQAWIMDFGLAKADDSENLTRTGDLVGTLRYMPPERFRGESDARSDVYSLGLTLYELMLLRPAFDAPDRETLLRQLTRETPVRPRRLQPGFPRDLETILLKAIEPRPAERYATAAALRDDLQRFLDDRSILARRASLVDRAVKWIHREPVVAGLTFSTLLLMVIAITGISWQWREAVAARNDAEANLKEVGRTRHDLYRQLYLADLRLAQAAIEKHRPREATDLLARHLPAEDHDDLRGFVWHHLWRQCHQGQTVHRLQKGPGIHPLRNGGHLYLLEAAAALHILDAETLAFQQTIDTPWTRVKLSPDGRWLAAQRGGQAPDHFETLWLIDTRTHQIAGEIAVELSSVWSFAFSRDSAALLVCGTSRDRTNGRGQFIRWGLNERHITARFERRDTTRDLACSPADGSFVVWSPQALEFRDPVSLEVRRTIPCDAANPQLLFTDNGRLLIITGSRAHDVLVVDPQTGAVQHRLSGHTLEVNDVQIVEHGSALLSSCLDTSIRLWDLNTGELRHTYYGHAGTGIRLLALTESDFLSTSADGEVRRWSTRGLSQQTTALGDPQSVVLDLAWNNTSDELLVAQSREMRRFRPGTQTFAPATTIPWESGHSSVDAIAVDPSGTIYLGITSSHPETRLSGTVFRQTAGSDHPELFATVPSPVLSLHLSPDGSKLACVPKSMATPKRNYSLTVLDTGNAQTLYESPFEDYIGGVCFTADSRRFVIACSKLVSVLNTNNWQLQTSLPREDANDDVFTGIIAASDSPDSFIISDSTGLLSLWMPHLPFPMRTFVGHDGFVNTMLVTPDQRQLVSLGYDRTVRFWDLETGTAIATLSATSAEAPFSRYQLALSPDGHILAANVGMTLVRLWDASPVDPPLPRP